MKYFNKATRTQLFGNPLVPAHLQYDAGNPDHAALPDSNPYFHPIPEGQQLTFSPVNVPSGLEPIPDYALNQAKTEKVQEIGDKFYQLALASGIDAGLDLARQDFQMRGPASPTHSTPEREAFYGNIAIADEAIATVLGYTTVTDVENFYTGGPAGSGYTGDPWETP